ncbi:MAG: hypothetical protein JWQ48_1981 [Conexibacter sp.]|nr:hypothetical protein [Conexibacter sp.]
MLSTRIRLVPALLLLTLGLAACGGSSSGDHAAVTTDQPALTGTTPTTPPATTATTPTTTPRTPTTSTATTPPATTTTPTTPAPTQTSTAPPSNTAPADTIPQQRSGGAPAGCPGAIGGFVKGVQASGTDCGQARDVASAWFDKVQGGASPDSSISAGGYDCSGSLEGERAAITCSGAGGSSVTFTASP